MGRADVISGMGIRATLGLSDIDRPNPEQQGQRQQG
jgi:hypothetical protein